MNIALLGCVARSFLSCSLFRFGFSFPSRTLAPPSVVKSALAAASANIKVAKKDAPVPCSGDKVHLEPLSTTKVIDVQQKSTTGSTNPQVTDFFLWTHKSNDADRKCSTTSCLLMVPEDTCNTLRCYCELPIGVATGEGFRLLSHKVIFKGSRLGFDLHHDGFCCYLQSGKTALCDVTKRTLDNCWQCHQESSCFVLFILCEYSSIASVFVVVVVFLLQAAKTTGLSCCLLLVLHLTFLGERIRKKKHILCCNIQRPTRTWWFMSARHLQSFSWLAKEVYSSVLLWKLELPAQESPTLEAFKPN